MSPPSADPGIQGPGPATVIEVRTILVAFDPGREPMFLGGQIKENHMNAEQTQGYTLVTNVFVLCPDGCILRGPEDFAGLCSVCLSMGMKTPVAVGNAGRCLYCNRLLCVYHRYSSPAGFLCPEHVNRLSIGGMAIQVRQP